MADKIQDGMPPQEAAKAAMSENAENEEQAGDEHAAQDDKSLAKTSSVGPKGKEFTKADAAAKTSKAVVEDEEEDAEEPEEPLPEDDQDDDEDPFKPTEDAQDMQTLDQMGEEAEAADEPFDDDEAEQANAEMYDDMEMPFES